jgi:hypothetical protein
MASNSTELARYISSIEERFMFVEQEMLGQFKEF